MGYSRTVMTVSELLQHGDTGLGTFEDVDGEMILADGICCRALEDGTVMEAAPSMGVPFFAVTFMREGPVFSLDFVPDFETLKKLLDIKIEEDFGLNSMHVVRIDGDFEKISARSESAYRSQHITLKEVLKQTQKDFFFEKISGTLICEYFPDYMDGINAPGWHLHFISEDRTRGGHVIDLVMARGSAVMNKISQIQIRLPNSPSFDTYSLRQASQDEIRDVEQGKK